MQTLPLYIYPLFIFSTLFTLTMLYQATRQVRVIIILIGWLSLQSAVAYTGFYTNISSKPPHLLFLIMPPMLFIIMLFVLKPGRELLNRIDTQKLTYLHFVRLPVEITLYLLFLNKLVPQLMTFEGGNYDILSGITAPVIAYFGYTKLRLNKYLILAWNFICLGLLFNIVIRAVLSAPYAFQQMGFEQPNVGILHFPFIWLPGFIVPAVLFSHLVSIRQIIINNKA